MILVVTAFTVLLSYGAFLEGAVIILYGMSLSLGAALLTVCYWLSVKRREVFRPGWPALFAILAVVIAALQLIPVPSSLYPALFPYQSEIYSALHGNGPPLPTLTPLHTVTWLIWLIAFLLVLFMAQSLSARFADRAILLAIPVIFAGGWEAMIGLLQFLTGEGRVVRGTYVSWNHFAGLLEMAIPLALTSALFIHGLGQSRGAVSAWSAMAACALLGLACLMCVGVILSLSRMGFLSMLSSLFVTGALLSYFVIGKNLSARLRWLPIALMAALSLAGLFFLPTDALTQRLARTASTGDIRSQIWTESLPLLGLSPVIGTGLGSYESAFLRFKHVVPMESVDHAHSDYIEGLVEIGVIGFTALGLLTAAALLNCLRTASRLAAPAQQFLAIGCAGSIVAIVVHSIADFNLHVPANALAMCWITGLSLGFRPIQSAWERTQTPSHYFPVRPVLLAAAILVMAGSAATIAGEGAIPVREGTRRWLWDHNFVSEGAILTAARATGETGDPNRSAAMWRSVLARDPANAFRWCDYGDALLEAGSKDEARRAFARASELAPFVPPVLMRAANFQFISGNIKDAAALYGRVLSLVHDYDPIIFLMLGRMGLSDQDVAANVLPKQRDAGNKYLEYVIAQDRLSGAETVWNWMSANHLTDDDAAAKYVDFLLKKDATEKAAHVWAQSSGLSVGNYLRPEHVFNGGFESEPRPCRLDWRIEKVDGAQSAIMPGEGTNGSRCLRIDFDGTRNVDYHHVSQTLWLPAGIYRIQARMRSDGLTTNQGLQLRLSSAGLDWLSDPLTGTRSWFSLDARVTVPASRSVNLEFVRRPSDKFDNKIKGTAWIDDVSIVPAKGGNSAVVE